MELLAVAIWSFVVAVAGGVAGLVLGNLRLPVLLQFASSPAAGAGANVAASGLSALTASVAHWRAGRIEWRLFWLMAPPSLLGGVAGGLISGLLPRRALLGAIALVVLFGAYEISRRDRFAEAGDRPGGGVATALTIAFAVGLLGGLVGLILGTLRLPAMVKWLGTSPKAAVGTNAATGTIVGLGGLLGHLPSGVDWALLWAAASGAIPGAYLGARLTGRLDDTTLLKAISAILVVAGLTLAGEAVLG